MLYACTMDAMGATDTIDAMAATDTIDTTDTMDAIDTPTMGAMVERKVHKIYKI